MAGLRILLAATALAAPFWLTMGVERARACTPPVTPGPSLQELVARADIILVGVPTHIRLINPLPEPTPLSPADVGKRSTFVGPGSAVVAVDEYLKGSGPAEVEVFQPEVIARYSPPDPPELTPYSSTTCDYFLSLQEEHLLFLHRRDDGLLETRIFAGSTPTASLGDGVETRLEEIRRIVAGDDIILPPVGSGATESQVTLRWLIVALGAGGAVLLVAAPLVRIRR